MAGIVPKSEAKFVDFCGGAPDQHYIIRSDFGCFMYSTNFHQGLNITVKALHPSCHGGDHYLASEGKFYIIKGKHYRCVSDLNKDFNSAVYDLHLSCQGGDHYLFAFGYFFIIFQSGGTYRRTSDLTTYKNGNEFKLHPNCKDGLYYWGTKNCIYLVKPKDQWGVQFRKTGNLSEDTHSNTYSVHPDVLNFLPGGLAETHGPVFAKWDLIRNIANDSDIPITWEQRLTWKVGYTKTKSSTIEHNWGISLNAMTMPEGSLSQSMVKYQLGLNQRYGGQYVKMTNENWEDVSEKEEKVTMTLKPKQKIYVWQYKFGLGKEDVLFCRDTVINNGPNPPTDTPFSAPQCYKLIPGSTSSYTPDLSITGLLISGSNQRASSEQN